MAAAVGAGIALSSKLNLKRRRTVLGLPLGPRTLVGKVGDQLGDLGNPVEGLLDRVTPDKTTIKTLLQKVRP